MLCQPALLPLPTLPLSTFISRVASCNATHVRVQIWRYAWKCETL